MFRKLLELKHWQFFVLSISVPILFQIIFVSTMFETRDPRNMMYFFLFIPLLVAWSVFFTFGWQWAIVNEFRDRIPDELKFNFKRIKAFIIVPAVYLLLFSILIPIFMIWIINMGVNGQLDTVDPIAIIPFFALIVPFHLFAIFCMFHNFYFVAKILKTAQLKRSLNFSDFAGEFFLIWFFIIGIWILQPQINKMIKRDDQTIDSDFDDVL